MADNMGTVAAMYEAFGRGDVGAILERLDDDISWEEGIRDIHLPYLKPGRGKQHVIDFFTGLAATVEFTQFDVGPLCDGGDVVTALVTVAGRIKDGGEIAAAPEAHIWRFGADGKVISFRHIGDWAMHEQAAAQVSEEYLGQTLDVVGDRVEVLQSGGAFEMFRVTGPRASGPPPHAHPWLESYLGLEGEVAVMNGDDMLTLTPGEFVTVPAGVVHTFRVASDTATFLIATGGHSASAFFADIAANVPPGPPNDDTLPLLIDVARRNRLTSPLFD